MTYRTNAIVCGLSAIYCLYGGEPWVALLFAVAFVPTLIYRVEGLKHLKHPVNTEGLNPYKTRWYVGKLQWRIFPFIFPAVAVQALPWLLWVVMLDFGSHAQAVATIALIGLSHRTWWWLNGTVYLPISERLWAEHDPKQAGGSDG